ncbi:MAG: Na+/H+ antiporter subunit E [Rhodocyclaceae bacterium]
MRIFGRLLLFSGLWWLLSEGRNDGWLLGSIAVAAASWASFRLWPTNALRVRFSALPGFFAYFVINSVRGGVQVAGMALRGKSALMPGFVDLALSLPAGAPQILLTYTLGLMPGTVGVELANGRLRVHALDVRLPVASDARALERRIAALFGVTA